MQRMMKHRVVNSENRKILSGIVTLRTNILLTGNNIRFLEWKGFDYRKEIRREYAEGSGFYLGTNGHLL